MKNLQNITAGVQPVIFRQYEQHNLGNHDEARVQYDENHPEQQKANDSDFYAIILLTYCEPWSDRI